MPFTPGENVGPYRIMEQLGQGGMATVFKAYHPGLDRFVAIKVMHPAFKQDPTFLARFQREARVVAKLDHPNIVPIYDYAEHNGNPYLVMKFIEGETLKARLSRKTPLTREEGLRIVDAVGKALGYAHARGILHRDIKPSNILLCPDGAVYLADFGLARIAQAGESTLSNEMLLGTPHYISPEQARGERNLDAGTDIYSFGVVLYEMVVGRVPFNADTPFSIIHDHIYTPLPLPRKINPKVPESVQRVLLKALAKDRADRYATVDELAASFLRAASGSAAARADAADTLVVAPPTETVAAAEIKAGAEKTGQTLPPVPLPTERPPEEPRKRRTWIWVAGGLGLIALCLLLLFAVSRKQRREAEALSLAGTAPVSATEEIRDPGVLAARATLVAIPDDPAAHFALAESEARAGFPLVASREYRKAAELFLRADASLPAAEAFLKAITNVGGPEKAGSDLVNEALRASFMAGGQEPQGALALFDEMISEYPDWPPLPSLQAHARIAMEDMTRARELIDKALEQDANDALALSVQAEWLRASGDEAGARRSAEAAKATGALPAWLATVINGALGQPPKTGLITIGGEGTGPGLFTDARSVGLDEAGRIYVGEYEGGRVQVFDAQGKFLAQWFADREFPLRGMAVRRDGAVYTVQHGEIVLRNGMTGDPISKINYAAGDSFDDVALSSDGGLLTAWYRNRDDLVVFNPNGETMLSIPKAVSQQTGEPELGLRVAVDGQGNLWALGVFSTAVFHFDASGHFVNRFGSQGNEPGQLNSPWSIAIDGKGRVYVGDFSGVQVFASDGRFVGRIDVEGPAYGLLVDPGGRLWVANGMYVRQYVVSLP
jgi:tRNA A-37 threonylcarbamoyl transferase component Bud32/DNA-binding beta-propeller fold protein YncE